MKKGRGFTTLSAQMVQHRKVTISTTVLFHAFAIPDLSNPLTVLPPKANSRWTPATTTPSGLKPLRQSPKFLFKDYFRWYEDTAIRDQNTSRRWDHAGGLAWGAVAELPGEKAWNQAMLGFAGGACVCC
jgi:hypothetical protein